MFKVTYNSMSALVMAGRRDLAPAFFAGLFFWEVNDVPEVGQVPLAVGKHEAEADVADKITGLLEGPDPGPGCD